MTTAQPAVFDCNVFLQVMLSAHGPAHACWENAVAGSVRLFVTPRIILEIRQLPGHKGLRRFSRFTPDVVERFIEELLDVAQLVPNPADRFEYPRDPDDAHYVDVAIATGALLVVSRDHDMLDLMSNTNAAGKRLRGQYPDFKVVTPVGFLHLIERSA